jgi:hypothetical protein
LIEVGEAILTGIAVLASVLGRTPRVALLVTLSAFTSGDRHGRNYRNRGERQHGDCEHARLSIVTIIDTTLARRRANFSSVIDPAFFRRSSFSIR